MPIHNSPKCTCTESDLCAYCEEGFERGGDPDTLNRLEEAQERADLVHIELLDRD